MPKTKRIRYRSDNKINYRQDRASHVGVPSGIDFTVKQGTRLSTFWLIGHGHGAKNDYGNGQIFIYKTTRQQRKKLEAACND